MKMHADTREFRLSIDITVTGHTDSDMVAPLVNDAMQELVNRRDFRAGTIGVGRAIDHRHDFEAVRITVDVNRLSVKPL